VFLSVRDRDKSMCVDVARALVGHGFDLVATRGTANAITAAGVTCGVVNKVQEGRPDVVDLLKNDEIALIVNTTEGKQAIADSFTIRRSALQRKVPYATTMAFARAIVVALERGDVSDVSRLQDLHEEMVR
jgi:carbamoyl-phosphate synthase large subunit